MHAFRLIGTYFIALLVLAMATRIASAQTVTTGDVTGIAFDSSGAVVANAEITLKNMDIGEARTVLSSAAGLYRFTFVRPGRYQLSASSVGLVSDRVEFAVAVGQVASVDLVMKVRPQKQVIIVTSALALLDNDNAHFNYVFSPRQWELLPLPGGDLVAVAYSAPGVVTNDRFGTGNFA